MSEEREKTNEEKRAENLAKGAWKPGQSGNPKGRPVGAKTGLRARAIQWLDQAAPENVLQVLEANGIKLNDRDKSAVVIEIVGRKALKGDLEAVKILFKETELPHPKDLNVSGDYSVIIGDLDASTLSRSEET